MDFIEVVSAHLGGQMTRYDINLSIDELETLKGVVGITIKQLEDMDTGIQADLDDCPDDDAYSLLLDTSVGARNHINNLISISNQIDIFTE